MNVAAAASSAPYQQVQRAQAPPQTDAAQLTKQLAGNAATTNTNVAKDIAALAMANGGTPSANAIHSVQASLGLG